MLMVISPAKSLDFENPSPVKKSTEPAFLEQSAQLVRCMKEYSANDLQDLMGISKKLADLNVERFKSWSPPFSDNNAKQSLFAFQGDVYKGLQADTLASKEIDWAQKHLRILSGLYGLLRPLDLIQPYRLEMGLPVAVRDHKNLYQFWGEQIADEIDSALKSTRSQFLVNLASNEYFKSIQKDRISKQIVTPVFKEEKDGKLKVMALFAKRARGAMSRYLIQNRIKDLDGLKSFAEDRYRFRKNESTDDMLVFARKYQPKAKK